MSSGNGRFGWLYKFNCTVNNCLGTTFGNLAAFLSMDSHGFKDNIKICAWLPELKYQACWRASNCRPSRIALPLDQAWGIKGWNGNSSPQKLARDKRDWNNTSIRPRVCDPPDSASAHPPLFLQNRPFPPSWKRPFFCCSVPVHHIWFQLVA